MFLLMWTVAGLLGLMASVAGLRGLSRVSPELLPHVLSSGTMVPGLVLYLFVVAGHHGLFPVFLYEYSWVFFGAFLASLFGLPISMFIVASLTWECVRERRWRRVWIPVLHGVFLAFSTHVAFRVDASS